MSAKDNTISITGKFAQTIFVLLFASSPCAEPQAVEDIRDPYYVGAGIGLSFLKPETGSVALSLSQDSDLAYGVFAGYQLDDNWAAEIFWTDMGQAEISAASTDALAGIIEYQAFGIGGLYQYPVSNSWDVFATAGVGRLRNHIQLVNAERVEDSFIYLGGGVIWNLAKTWDVRAEYDYYDEDAQTVTFNIVKRFGSATPKRIRRLERQVAEQEKEIQLARSSLATAPAKKDVNKSENCDDYSIDLDGVVFARRSVEIDEQSKQVIDTAISKMITLPGDIRFEVRAHTDDEGTELYNYSLSLARARMVRDYMAQNGIALDRIDAQGYGEWRPRVDNSTERGKKSNRRAELVVLGVERYVEQTDTCPELATPMPSVPR
jgi:outer membrane protein OmpA-like peptidoglycan-associated protein